MILNIFTIDTSKSKKIFYSITENLDNSNFISFDILISSWLSIIKTIRIEFEQICNSV